MFSSAALSASIIMPKKPPPMLLMPLPIIGVTFKRVEMDTVGPLPKFIQDHKNILVIVYATHYPEAVSL